MGGPTNSAIGGVQTRDGFVQHRESVPSRPPWHLLPRNAARRRP